MKIKTLNLILFLFSISINTTAKIVERPAFTAWSSQTLEIDKIIISDYATALFIDAFLHPDQRIKIAPESFIRTNSLEYQIEEAIGINLGEEIHVHEARTISFQLIFPPIPPDTKEIDFLEGYSLENFCIWGIRLDGELPQVDIASIAQQEKEISLYKAKLNYKEAILKLNILGYKPEMNIQSTIHTTCSLTGRTHQHSSKINPDGTACISIPLLHPAQVHIQSTHINSYIYLVPDEELTITINLPEKTRSESRYLKKNPSQGNTLYFSGALAKLNKEIYLIGFPNINHFYPDTYEEMITRISTMNAQQYEEYFTYWYREYANPKSKFLNFRSLEYKTLYSLDSSLLFMQILLSGKSMIESAYRIVNQIDEKTEIPQEACPTFTSKHFTFLKLFFPNNSQILYSNHLYSLTQHLLQYLYIPGINEKENLPSFPEIIQTNEGFIFDWLKLVKLASPLNSNIPLTTEQLAAIKSISPEAEKYLNEINMQLKILEDNTQTYPDNLGKDGCLTQLQTGFMGVDNMYKLLNTELEK